MHVIHARNVNDAYRQGVSLVRQHLHEPIRSSRAGNVYELGPVTTVYADPTQCILWDAKRDANPFFHLFEALWMLAGRNDVHWLEQFSKNIADFSTDHGAYGYRWRQWFGFDQILAVVHLLRNDPMTRRAVLTMWDPEGDFLDSDGSGGICAKDIPCNLMIKFEARRGVLDMMVFNRSNDMLFGAYGANAVHMALLQEFVACCISIPVGAYWQVSANFHAYESVWNDKVRADGYVDQDLYACMQITHCRLIQTTDAVRELGQISEFVDKAVLTGNPFLDGIALPLLEVWQAWKGAGRAIALLNLQSIPDQANEWVVACRRWMERRIRK